MQGKRRKRGNSDLRTLTISVIFNQQSLDIAVKEEQRITEILGVLQENGLLFISKAVEDVTMKSWRLGTFVNTLLTFKQANIENGDILILSE